MVLDVLWRMVSVLAASASSDLAAVTGAVLIGALLLAVLRLVQPATPADFPDAGRAVRSRAVRTGVPRHRDPDAPGRTRPRGPTGDMAVA